MKRIACLWLLPLALAASAADTVTFRVRFGMKDTEPTDWSGSIKVTPGRVVSIRGWRWTSSDSATGDSWTVATRRLIAMDSVQAKKVREGKLTMPIGDNGVIITLADTEPSSEIEITFTGKPDPAKFKLSAIPYGQRFQRWQNAIEIERCPTAAPLAETDADEDYPAAAVAKDGTVYVAYVAFTRGSDFPKQRETIATPEVKPKAAGPNAPVPRVIAKPEDFDYLAAKTGGDRVWLRVRKNGEWGGPIAVTDGATEVYRPALAMDGGGRLWIFYPAQLNADANGDHGNWELMARSFSGGKLGAEINVSHAPGPDFAPAAATDSTGSVWVTWMGGRGTSFDIFAAKQEGEKLSTPIAIASTDTDEWDPAIAADAKGNLAIAWDTYQKGDFDVYVALRGADGKFGAAMPVAATLNFEARPSLAYDGDGALWIAWEQGDENWGKDFGPLKKFGVPIFMSGRTLGVKVLRNGRGWFTPPDVMKAMPGMPRFGGRAGQQAPKATPLGPAARKQAAPCFPRLATDARGRVWLALRGRPQGQWRVPVGPVFYEYVTRMDGDQWLPAMWLPRSNNALDNRPAWAPLPDGGMLIAYSGDGRAEINPEVGPGAPAAKGAGKGGAGRALARRRLPDANNNVFVAQIAAPENIPASKLEAAEPSAPAAAPAAVAEERAAVQRIHDYRVNLNGETLRLWRGDFHRHTEFSPDGGSDGAFLDTFRYSMDAAGQDWVGNGDHDNGDGREYSWWTIQKGITLFTLPGRYVPMFTYERSVNYPEGHRNCVFARRGIRTLPRLPISDPNLDNPPPAPDTQLLYQYLRHFDGVCAEHTSGTDMGTDWRNNDPLVEPFVEIYQGERNSYERPDAPRSAVTEAEKKKSTPEEQSIGGWRPKGFVSLALKKGYRLAFQSSSDHVSTHLSYCNVWVTEPTREAILDAMKKRRVYASTDHILADMRCKAGGKEHFMGEEFTTAKPPTLNIKLVGIKPLARVTVIKDDEVVYTAEPNQKEVSLNWTDTKATPGQASYYYVRGEQVPDMEGVTGEIVWISPMWIKYQP